jgi:four helix bundle protein
MSTTRQHSTLIAHDKALEAAGTAIRLVMRVPTPLKSIADQVIRAAASVPANLAEGAGRCGRDRHNLWRIAYASAREVDSHLRLLAHAGAVDGARAAAALAAFDEVLARSARRDSPPPASGRRSPARPLRRGIAAPATPSTTATHRCRRRVQGDDVAPAPPAHLIGAALPSPSRALPPPRPLLLPPTSDRRYPISDAVPSENSKFEIRNSRSKGVDLTSSLMSQTF